MILALYNLLWRMARPLLLRKLQRRGAQEPGYLHAVHQRFADYTTQEREQAQAHAGQWVWVHAVSLGETRAAGILLQALREAQPGLRLLLTHGTATGRQEGQKLLHAGDLQVWLPWDERGAVKRFVQTFRPRVGLMLETEIWPQLLRTCQQEKVPVALVNARLSEKTLRQWHRLPRFAQQTYGSLAMAFAQTEQDAAHLRTLGADPVLVTGNLKFDAVPDAALMEQGRALRQRWQAHEATPRRVALLASSREGEEAMWLQALQALSAEQREAVQWLVVPRHPQRFDEVAALLQTADFAVHRRSTEMLAAGTSTTVWLGDSMGEMPMYYAMADLALMGGSFEALGGQNLIEACACGCPVLLGPHTFNFSEASEQAIAAGAALRRADMAQAVQQALDVLLSDDAHRLQTMQQAARAFSQAHRGAAARTVSHLQQRGWLG
ncbi:MAG: 3-deoxy-D-manno-octulosonic acid transferase [Brachymonas sp.]|nr:3-deoxy-D-manno-octulosonic acid transferase [Brachymonas sp.]